jgi:hypothetical protein
VRAPLSNPTPAPPVKLTLDIKEAAAALGIGERLLWSLTAPRGPIPCVRVGRRVLYPVADLEAFVAARKEGGRP